MTMHQSGFPSGTACRFAFAHGLGPGTVVRSLEHNDFSVYPTSGYLAYSGYGQSNLFSGR